MSYDFAVIPVASFATVEEAMQICDVMFDEPQRSPSPQVTDLLDELERRDAIGDDGFLSMWPVDANIRGAVLCTRWWKDLTYTMLELTKDRGLAVVDLQTRQLFDPRGRVDVQVGLGDGTNLPYLTTPILKDLITRPHHQFRWLIVKRADQQFIQAHFSPAADCVLEYRDGVPDHHYRATTSDRSLVERVVWGWTMHGPDKTDDIGWDRIASDQF